MFSVAFYEDRKGVSEVRNYINQLSDSEQDKIFAYIERLTALGFDLKRPAADSLGDKLGLYELRPGRQRIIYFFCRRTTIVLLSIFLKKSDAIPTREIRIALKRKTDYLERKVLP